jgi:hypothetical protein
LQNNSRGSSGYRAGSGQVNGSFTKNEKRYTEEEEEHRQKILNRVIHYVHNELYKFNNVIFFSLLLNLIETDRTKTRI